MRIATVIHKGEIVGQETFTQDEYQLVYALLTSYPLHLLYAELLSVVPGYTLDEMKVILRRAHLKTRTLRIDILAVLETGYVLIRRYH